MMLESNVFMQLLGRLFSAGGDCSRVGTRIAAGDTVEVACVRACVAWGDLYAYVSAL